jgi:hypothetical protein
MTYVHIINGAVAAYPYSFHHLRADNRQVSFPRDMDDARLKDFGVFAVSPTTQPATDLTQNLVELDPALVGGVWVQVWSVVPASAQEIADRQLAASDAVSNANVRTDAFVQTFIGMTPAEVSDYIDNNTANLATTRELLKKMAVMLLILARREFR